MLLVPQDGVLVTELQLLQGGPTAAFLSATVLVLHHLKGLLHLPVSETRALDLLIKQTKTFLNYVCPAMHVCKMSDI